MLRVGLRAGRGGEPDAFLRARLLSYQIPVFITVVDDVPRTGSIKPVCRR